MYSGSSSCSKGDNSGGLVVAAEEGPEVTLGRLRFPPAESPVPPPQVVRYVRAWCCISLHCDPHSCIRNTYSPAFTWPFPPPKSRSFSGYRFPSASNRQQRERAGW